MIDSSGQNPPEQAQMMLDAVAIEIAAGRGEISWLDALPRLRTWWLRDGLIAITSGGAAIEMYGYLGDIDTAIATHAEVVTSVSKVWQYMVFRGPSAAGGFAARPTRERSAQGDRRRP